ncbi:alpha/beta hydrolase family protein [Dyella ginsengisoli]|uniref:alpha/beta hydrolase family protein n=1 Tax=Dyella ginsengisoli TaxID=363848 RepID=UPI0003493D3C|nr:prolyl oligopeptidase family serine peptidase [Dyella ginsengisoli]
MQKHLGMALLGAVLGCVTVAAGATDLIPVESFARHPAISTPRLSPDGQYLAVRMDGDDGAHALVVFQVADMSHPASMLRMPKYEVPANFVWVSPTRLIIEKGREYGSIEQPRLTGEILATDFDGKNQDYLFGIDAMKYGRRASTRGTDRGWGFFDGKPDHANGHFYMAAEGWDSNHQSSLYDVDAERNTRHLIGDIGVSGMSFMVGKDGQAHYAFGTNIDFDYVVYHRVGSSWSPMTPSQVGVRFNPLESTPDGQHVYATYSADGGPSSLVSMAEDGSDRQVIARADFGSVGVIEWTAKPEQPFATTLATGVPTPRYVDPNAPMAKLHRALSLKFPGSYVHFVNFSDDGSELLFGVSSDRTPGTYFLINTRTYKVQKLFDVEPWINPAQMAERRPVTFIARDGTPIEAILTLPRGAGEKNLPMVLLPHGGPIGIEDDWFYDSDAQFLANRGYLVLQINFRGSGGRGVDFQQAGYQQWGTGIVQDLIDGTRWTIAQGYADPKRICVYGASYGGYAAMMAPIRAPGLFKCAVGYAGIYDMAMRYKKGDTRESELGRNALRAEMGDDTATLDANSPDKLADKIDVPVLLIHGEDDQRAPFAQFKAMTAALDAAHKPYQTLVKPGEGHGFYDEKNNIDLLNTLQAFLEKHIGKGG